MIMLLQGRKTNGKPVWELLEDIDLDDLIDPERFDKKKSYDGDLIKVTKYMDAVAEFDLLDRKVRF